LEKPNHSLSRATAKERGRPWIRTLFDKNILLTCLLGGRVISKENQFPVFLVLL
jgi:hypothetical protein